MGYKPEGGSFGPAGFGAALGGADAAVFSAVSREASASVEGDGSGVGVALRVGVALTVGDAAAAGAAEAVGAAPTIRAGGVEAATELGPGAEDADVAPM